MTTLVATPSVCDTWTYPRGMDICGEFFDLMMRSFRAPIAPDANVLEVGCAEFDWLRCAHTSWPEMRLTGLDVRPQAARPGVSIVAGDVMDRRHFPANSFDWIVSVSAIEHIGLGHYTDPTAADGDTKALATIWHWLKPGGWFAFDVPYQPGPDGYMVDGTRTRIYDDATIASRLKQKPWHEAWTGTIYLMQPYKLVTDPEPLPHLHKYDMYVRGQWWQKR
jgi:SAM-dependent methyltransferase